MSEASPRDRYPEPGQPAPVLTAHDKRILALTGTFSPFAAVGWIASAGYEQATNGAPNWGTDRGAFGVRLGDSALRAISEDYTSDGIYAVAFHEDPRYYRLGPQRNFVYRVVYAVTRSIVTRTDSGNTSANYSQICGNLTGAVLENAYYPAQNRTFKDTMVSFGGGLGGTAVGNVVEELFGDLFSSHH